MILSNTIVEEKGDCVTLITLKVIGPESQARKMHRVALGDITDDILRDPSWANPEREVSAVKEVED